MVEEARTYALLNILDGTAPVYQVVEGNQRVQITKMPVWQPFMEITFMEGGESKTIRFKQTAKSIYKEEQVDKQKIAADAPFTSRERDALKFRNGFIMTQSLRAQEYLEKYPACEGSEVESEDVPRKLYKRVDITADNKIANEDLGIRVRSAYKVLELDLADAQELLIRITGAYSGISDNSQDCQKEIIQRFDGMESSKIKDVMETVASADEKVNVLVAKLTNYGVLSFDKIDNAVSRNDVAAGKWSSIKEIPSSYPPEERKRYFIMYLTSPDGKMLLSSLQAALDKKEAKTVKSKAKEEVKSDKRVMEGAAIK